MFILEAISNKICLFCFFVFFLDIQHLTEIYNPGHSGHAHILPEDPIHSLLTMTRAFGLFHEGFDNHTVRPSSFRAVRLRWWTMNNIKILTDQQARCPGCPDLQFRARHSSFLAAAGEAER